MATSFDVAYAIVTVHRSQEPKWPTDTQLGTAIKTATGSSHSADEFAIDVALSRVAFRGHNAKDIGDRAISRG